MWPLATFVEWAERVPEFRDALAEQGMGWGASVGPAEPEGRRHVTEPSLPGEAGECCFRANIGGRYVNVKLFGVVGTVIKVRVEGAPTGQITAIQIGQVSPVDRERVEKVIAGLPGSQAQLFFDDQPEPAPETGDDRMRVLPVPLPPPHGDGSESM